MELQLTRSQLMRCRTAVFAIFLASGLSIATWASRVPAIKATLGIDNIEIGMLLLGAGASSIIGVFMARAFGLRSPFFFAAGALVVTMVFTQSLLRGPAVAEARAGAAADEDGRRGTSGDHSP